MSGRQRDGERREEAREILKRVEQDSDPLRWRHASKASDYPADSETRDQEWAELWGRRIGRALAVIFAAILIVWLWFYLAGGEI